MTTTPLKAKKLDFIAKKINKKKSTKMSVFRAFVKEFYPHRIDDIQVVRDKFGHLYRTVEGGKWPIQ